MVILYHEPLVRLVGAGFEPALVAANHVCDGLVIYG